VTEDISLGTKIEFAQRHAAELEAGRHFFDAGQPHWPLGFSIIWRNPGHWDVYAAQAPGKRSAWLAANPGGETSAKDGGNERAFRIRGEPGKVAVYDERWNPHRPHPRGNLNFRSIMAAMVWICEELMQEPA
jgi:hypothetical protein